MCSAGVGGRYDKRNQGRDLFQFGFQAELNLAALLIRDITMQKNVLNLLPEALKMFHALMEHT